MTSIIAREVTHRFGALTAVDRASLTVGPGEVVGLVGPNGAGKTTLIRLLLGLVTADTGEVRLAGGVPSRTTRARVGYVPQSLGLWHDLTLDEHLALVGAVYGSPPPVVEDALATVRDRPVGSLPLGLRRRAAFAVALSHDPEVLILDEPTSGVDPLARERLWDVVRATAGRGVATLVSTHYLDEAARCDRVVLMSAGRVVASGPVAELTTGHTAVQVRAPEWQRAWHALEAAGLQVTPAGRTLRVAEADRDVVAGLLAGAPGAEVTQVAATLEEVFLTLTDGRR